MAGRVKIGELAPDVILKTVDGEAISLATSWQNGRHSLLIFLRHLA